MSTGEEVFLGHVRRSSGHSHCKVRDAADLYSADPFKSSFTIPKFYATLEVRVEDPISHLSLQVVPGMEPASPKAISFTG